MSEAWDLRSNIKAKPGSQGTLFQPGDRSKVLHPTLRYPRGYTPGRLAEVRKGLASAYIETPEHLSPESGNREPGDYKDEMGYRETHVIPPIARSTIPAMHLEDLKEIKSVPDQGTHGTYYPGKGVLAVDMTATRDDDPQQTLIHELGHHYHDTNPFGKHAANEKIIEAGTAHARQQKEMRRARQPFLDPKPNRTEVVEGATAVQAGVHEGLADNYLTTHYRTPGRRPQPIEQGAYEQNFAEANLQRKYPGYRDVRPREEPKTTMQRNASGLQFDRRDSAIPGAYSPKMIKGMENWPNPS